MHNALRSWGDTVNHRSVDTGYQISEEEIRDHNIGVTHFDKCLQDGNSRPPYCSDMNQKKRLYYDKDLD